MKHILTRIILCASMVLSTLYASAQDEASITKEDSLNNSNGLVQVAYRQIAKEDVLGGISSVNVSDLMKKDYFTYSLDNVIQAFTGGYNGNLWAMNGCLVLVDGVPRAANNVLPSEIENISFLKSGAAVALYGSQAAKGVIYITTKRGKVTQGKEISIHANTGFNVPKSYPEYLGSAQYMTLYNEARANDGLTPSFDDATIYNYASGNNPYRYPSVDFFSSDYLKKAYNYSDANAEISGGNDRAKYYTNIGFYYQNSLLNFGEGKNNNVNRLNIRGNIDLKVNNWISGKVDATATYYNGRNANGDFWGASATLRPYRVAPLIPVSFIEETDENSMMLVNNSSNLIDGKYLLGGTQLDQGNAFADVYASGYNTYTSRQFQFNTSIDFDLARLLKGLSFHTLFAIDYATEYIQQYINSYAVYEPVWNNYSGVDLISSLTKYNDDKKDGVQNVYGSADMQTITFSGQFNYAPVIGNDQHLNATLVAAGYQQLQSISYSSNPTAAQMYPYYHRAASNVNLGLDLSYNYLQKYYADLSGTAVHSAKLAPDNRNAFSPALTLGWRMSKENFLSGSPVLDDLTLSASASELHQDIDISGYYLYDANYTQNSGWYSWNDGGGGDYLTLSQRGANNNLGFVKRKEISVSLNASLWKKLLTADVSIFKNRMDGMLVQAQTIYPSYFITSYPGSNFVPYVNFNIDDRQGIDFNVNLNKKIGAVDLTLGAAGIYYTTNAVKRDENYADAYQNRAGHPINGYWGLKSAGFFKDENDVANSPTQSFGQVQQGDIKYVDQNHDGVIDSKDEVYLGTYSPPMTLGVHLEAKWNNFTFFILGTGYYGAYGMKSNSYWWVQGDGKYSNVVLNRWTETTASTATYPRLTSLTSDNNFRSSDFWLYSTDQFNISRVQLTYDFPEQLFRNGFIHGFSVYAGGSNLLMLAKNRDILEMNIGSTPQCRYYNVGFKALF